jgi:uncharacterized Zn finger protein
MAEPKCPECNIQGVNNIVAAESREQYPGDYPEFLVVHCNSCGHVYGVFVKHVISSNMSSPMPFRP